MVKQYVQKFVKKFKEQLDKAARSKITTHEIALGMAIGTFIGFLPLFGFQVIVGLILVFFFNINKIATFLGIFITNPVTIPPIFALNYYVGKLLLGTGPIVQEGKFFTVETLLHNFKPLVVGSLVMGVIAAIGAYSITYAFVKNLRKMQLKEKMKQLRIAKKVKKELKRFKT